MADEPAYFITVFHWISAGKPFARASAVIQGVADPGVNNSAHAREARALRSTNLIEDRFNLVS
jgi:hypothetical protein